MELQDIIKNIKENKNPVYMKIGNLNIYFHEDDMYVGVFERNHKRFKILFEKRYKYDDKSRCELRDFIAEILREYANLLG